MPFVAGDSLRDRMTRGAAPVAEAVGILRGIARRATAIVQPQDGCSLGWPVCRTEARVEIVARLGQRAAFTRTTG
jgi:hypothetical protein